jgi:uncharacterized protein (TIGR00730 family)
MRSISVFCGSSNGYEDQFMIQANLLGQTLAKRNIRVIYGGANVGLMGAVADGALEAGGDVVGVLPGFLQEKELAHKNLTKLILVDSMHERKRIMSELCDGVIALPGGFGTLEEFFEMLTWGQLGLHKKPVAIFNINNFYKGLEILIKTMTRTGFLKPQNKDMLLINDDIEVLLDLMSHYKAPEVGKWIVKERENSIT